MIKETEKEKIIKLYTSGEHTTESIAFWFNTQPRTVQRIVKAAGKIRTAAESNKLMARHKNYESLRVPLHLKAKRKHLTKKQRYEILNAQPWCTVCGGRSPETRLQVDHINNDATDNRKENLQVLCIECNYGKR